jgi:hypothetical protein
MSKKLTTEEFILRARAIHGDRYDFSKTKYGSAHEQVTVTCKVHGDIQTRPANFLSGKGCRHCGRVIAAESQANTTAGFIEVAKSKHGDRYDYSRTDYKGATRKVVIGCVAHGYFLQTPQNHLQNNGCKQCGLEARALTRMMTNEEFIRRAKIIHGDRYSYSRVEYQGVFKKVEILCQDHGYFSQTPDRHLAGCGCSGCAAVGPSLPELELLDFVRTLDPDVEGSNRSVIGNLELDIFSAKHRIAVEFHGLYYHSDKFRPANYHLDKLKLCQTEGIDLIQVFEDEWADPIKRRIVESIIQSRFWRYSNRIAARKTEKRKVSAKEARAFLTDNHIQGFTPADHYDGLYSKGELVSLMLMSKPRAAITKAKSKYDLELVRFASKLNTQVQGGFTKLLKPYQDRSIVTYCDRRVFNAKGYEKCGFVKMRNNAPEYYYTKGGKRFSRYGFQRSKLASKLKEFDPALTERENMLYNGYHRIYGCGTTTFALNGQNAS